MSRSLERDIVVTCDCLISLFREGLKKKKKLTEFSVKVGGWGQQRTNFPFLGAKAPLELAHVKNKKKSNGTEKFGIA